MTRSIYVAGTGQHSGKTMVSLGLLAVLRERGYRVAYMKPVGQRTVCFAGAVVDEDVALIHQVYNLSAPPALANPVTVPSGYTRRFLAEGRSSQDLMDKITDAFQQIAREADLVVVEGTGHAGVGAVLGLSNAKVARLLGSHVIIVTGGGIGRPIDEFELNRALFQEEQVPVHGMISNKVQPARVEETTSALTAWARPRGYPLWGTIPYEPCLTEISLAQITEEIGARVVSGIESLERRVRDIIIGAAPCHRLLQFFDAGILMITPGDRDDLVLAAISWDQTHQTECGEGLGVCLTSDVLPHEDVLKLTAHSHTPVIASSDGTYNVAARVSGLVAKMTFNDQGKIERARELVEKHVDVDGLIASLPARAGRDQ